MQIQHTFFMKNQHAASKFYITDMGKLVSTFLYSLKKESRDLQFSISSSTIEKDSVPCVIALGFLLYNTFLSLREY